MRILHVIPSLDPAGGGPPAVATRLAAAQSFLGHEVQLLYYQRPEDTQRTEAALATVPHLRQVRLHPVLLPGRMELLTARAAARAAAPILGQCDMVHLHGIWEPLLRRIAGAAAHAGRPYTITPHGMLDPWSMAQSRWKKRLAMALGWRRMLQHAAFLHALNADEQRLMEPLGLRPPVRVVPNGVFIEEIDPLPAPGSFRRKHPELNDDPFVLFLSRLHYKKGLDYLADAFAELAAGQPRLRLVVAGPDGGYENAFREKVRGLGLQERVHVIGPVYGPDKLAAMVDAACFCLPSRQEGFSVAITEALACGTPVVISEPCHFPEVAEVGAGAVTPLDARAVADGLRRVLDDEIQRCEMGRSGAELVRTRFTWPVIAERMLSAYQLAVAGG